MQKEEKIKMNEQLSLQITSRIQQNNRPIDPYIHHLNRINDIKRQHYEKVLECLGTRNRMDYIFCVLYRYGNLTDSEIQQKVKQIYNVWLKDNIIPARRANINQDEKFYKNWRIVVAEHRICGVMNTLKCAWKLEYINEPN